MDRSFSPVFNNSVLCMAEQDNGALLVGGYFTETNGMVRNHLARLGETGSLDSGFDRDVNSGAGTRVACPTGRCSSRGISLRWEG